MIELHQTELLLVGKESPPNSQILYLVTYNELYSRLSDIPIEVFRYVTLQFWSQFWNFEMPEDNKLYVLGNLSVRQWTYISFLGLGKIT